MQQPQKFRKKPVQIEAMEWNGTPKKTAHVRTWAQENGATIHYPTAGQLIIETLEGDMTVSIGDYVIRGVQGEFYPCKPDIFAATYEEVTA